MHVKSKTFLARRNLSKIPTRELICLNSSVLDACRSFSLTVVVVTNGYFIANFGFTKAFTTKICNHPSCTIVPACPSAGPVWWITDHMISSITIIIRLFTMIDSIGVERNCWFFKRISEVVWVIARAVAHIAIIFVITAAFTLFSIRTFSLMFWFHWGSHFCFVFHFKRS